MTRPSDSELTVSGRAAMSAIKAKQASWAATRGGDSRGYFPVERRYTNLLHVLSPEDEVAFSTGAGNELETKMLASHSSSALAFNVFATLRCNPETARLFAHLVGVASPPAGTQVSVSFERKRPTSWSGFPPHLDVEVAWDTELLAVESKFSETFTAKRTAEVSLRPYLAALPNDRRWLGATGLRQAAERVSREGTRVLDSAQLIKHALGLVRAQSEGRIPAPTLVLAWYDPSAFCPAATLACDQLRTELQQLATDMRPDLVLCGVTYQEILDSWQHELPADQRVAWLCERYA